MPSLSRSPAIASRGKKDVPVGFGCRNGVCHYCETGLLSGDVDYVTEPLEAPDSEHVLMCCARPAGEVTVEL
jgi:ferredoxin